MAKDFTQMTDAELGKVFRSRYDRLCAAFDMGLDDGPHPSERWQADTEILKAHREASTQDEATGLGPVYIQNKGARDNPPGGPGQPKAPMPAQDGKTTIIEKAQDRYSVGSDNVPRFEFAAGGVLYGNDAILARAAQSNPSQAKRMEKLIPGYGRRK